MKKLLALIVAALVLSFSGCSSKEAEAADSAATKPAEAEVSAYLVGTYVDADTAEAKLTEAGFEVITAYKVDKKGQYISIVYTNEAMKAAADKTDRGFAAIGRLLVNNEKKEISIANPIYFGKAFMQDEFDYQAALALEKSLTDAFGPLTGSAEKWEYEGLAGYHFMMGMPYYEENAVLAEGELNHLAACAFANPENQIVSPVVAEDVAFGLENMGLAPETIQIRVEEALRWVGLWERAAHFSHHLSGGEQQRLILAGVLAQQKRCLLLDDPLCMVAGRSRDEILKLLKSIHTRELCTMVHTTHLLEEALFAERLVALENGTLVFDDSPGRFLQEKELVEQLGLEVPAIADLGEMLANRGLVEPGEVVTLEQLLEFLTVSDHRKDNKTVEI